jgi:hypothetical protein
MEIKNSLGKPLVVVVYAPWCPFSQKMEEEYENLVTFGDNLDTCLQLPQRQRTGFAQRQRTGFGC